MAIAYDVTLGVPKIMDFAIPPTKSGPCSRYDIIIVDRKIAGKTEKIPDKIALRFDNTTDTAMTNPAIIPLMSIFSIEYLTLRLPIDVIFTPFSSKENVAINERI